jgi:hypothetical protein
MSGPKCWFCTRPLSAAEFKRRIEYRVIGGRRAIFGAAMPDGNLSEAHGDMEGVLHNKCHFASESREAIQASKGDDAPRESPDWRDQEVIDVGKLVPGASHGSHRGTGAQGQ